MKKEGWRRLRFVMEADSKRNSLMEQELLIHLKRIIR
jgi:hypothetical protein